jgi:hypothetical protein
LKVEGNEQAVIVRAEEPIVDVESVATSSTFDNSMLQNIPSGRDVWSTVAQAPGTMMNDKDKQLRHKA